METKRKERERRERGKKKERKLRKERASREIKEPYIFSFPVSIVAVSLHGQFFAGESLLKGKGI